MIPLHRGGLYDRRDDCNRDLHAWTAKRSSRVDGFPRGGTTPAPWVRVEKCYTFEAPGATETRSDLFAGRSQLIVQHFMFGLGWREGCVGCSFQADHVDGALAHLAQRDVTFVAVS